MRRHDTGKSRRSRAAGIQLELLTGPLTGIYDPGGMGSMLFAWAQIALLFAPLIVVGLWAAAA